VTHLCWTVKYPIGPHGRTATKTVEVVNSDACARSMSAHHSVVKIAQIHSSRRSRAMKSRVTPEEIANSATGVFGELVLPHVEVVSSFANGQ